MYNNIEFFEHPLHKGYYASKSGEVLNRYYRNSVSDNPKILKQHTDKDGYLRVGINGVPKMAHDIIWEACENMLIPQGYEVDHISTIRNDNRIENLRLCTRKENCNNPITLNHYSEAKQGKVVSEETKKKISEAMKGILINNKAKSKQVLQISKTTGQVLSEWKSTMEIERQRGYANSHISACCRGERKSAYGYYWKYV